MTGTAPGARTAALIPARWASTRFPGKALVPLNGKPMIAHVVERCLAADGLDAVIVATDDDRVARAAQAAGAQAAFTGEAPSGSDRIAAVARDHPELEWIVNVQGDEPTLDPAVIGALLERLKAGGADVTTVVRRFGADEDPADPNRVKAVVADDGRALYFSRALVPHGADATQLWLHMGLYAFSRAALLDFAAQPPSPLERSERLEQLRLLEAGATVVAVETTWRGLSVDTPDDVEAVETQLQTGIL